eukprot:4907623-Alexandrium_andersonii.AAC.1
MEVARHAWNSERRELSRKRTGNGVERREMCWNGKGAHGERTWNGVDRREMCRNAVKRVGSPWA